VDPRVKELLLKYEKVREGLSLYLLKYNVFVAGLFEQVRHAFDHIARCYVLYQIGGKSPNDREIVKNIERANNHIDRLELDMLKSLMFAEGECFDRFANAYKEHLKKEQMDTITSEMINFLTICDKTSDEIEECITNARYSECTAKDIITKGKAYENAYKKICNKVKAAIRQCPLNTESPQVNKPLSKTIKNDIDDKTTTLREICEFYWNRIKNDISRREIKRNEFDVNSLLLLVETLDYVAWYAIKGNGLGDAKQKLQKLHIEIHRSLLRSAEKGFDTMLDTIDTLRSTDMQFLNIKDKFHRAKQSIQDEVNGIDNDTSYDGTLARLMKCYENVCKLHKECLFTYREYKNRNALHNTNIPIL
jgi:hypothetical protein